jgi:hypothetical protein
LHCRVEYHFNYSNSTRWGKKLSVSEIRPD